MSAPQLKVRLDLLTSGPVREVMQMPTDWCAERLGTGFLPAKPSFSVDVDARRAAEVVEANCRITGGYKLDCSRCGDGLQLPFDVSFTHRFVPPGSLDAGDDEFGDLFNDDPDISEHNGSEVDLLPVCIEHAILALPFAPSCGDLPTGPCEKWTDEPQRFGDEFPEDEEDESPFAALKGLKLPDGPAKG